MRLMLPALLALGCAGTPLDECEAQKANFSCGVTTTLAINCEQFKNKTCDAQQLTDWLRCERAGHVSSCSATALDPTMLSRLTEKCLPPTCSASPTTSGEPE